VTWAAVTGEALRSTKEPEMVPGAWSSGSEVEGEGWGAETGGCWARASEEEKTIAKARARECIVRAESGERWMIIGDA